MLFNKKKLREEKIKFTKEKMQKLFKDTIHDNDYSLVYGYNRDFDNKLGDYTYTSLIIAYNEKDMNLIIIETNKEIDEAYNVIKLTRDDLKKASVNSLDEYIIYLNNKQKSKLKFSLLDKNYIDIDILAYIEQSEEIEYFRDFFIDFKRKKYKRSN